MSRRTARIVNGALWAATVIASAAVGTLAANGQDVPLWLQIANAALAGLAGGQHLPRPLSGGDESA